MNSFFSLGNYTLNAIHEEEEKEDLKILLPTHVICCLSNCVAALNSSNIKNFLLSSRNVPGSLRNLESVANNAMPTYYNSFYYSYRSTK